MKRGEQVDKLIRLFDIIMAIQANPGITAKALAFKCDCSVRTIYRYIDMLEPMTPLRREGGGSGYRFAGQFYAYPLDLTEQETLAFSLLPSLVDRNKMPAGFETAHDKVMSALAGKSPRHHMLGDITDVIQMGMPAYRPDNPNWLAPIVQAILENRTLAAVYHTQSSNETKERRIDPYCLVPRDQRYYLIGFCHANQEIRTFRVSRFLQVEPTEDVFDKGSFNIRTYLKHTWSIQRGDKNIRFKVRFSSAVARYVQEKELFVEPKLTPLADGGLLFEVTVNNEREFLKWVMQYGPDAEIVSPATTRQKMKVKLAEWSLLYD
ncbi:WYL domain-containing transcriptional regulator [Paenibacillus athensensis]|uniref:Transcriptional regulator n=1 Tax=Paenibacillus athensensis TaxID=1967502 RepID=A0A4Y8PYJ0_9BACL|nr:WYL domain-containing transcriptional regulator [Paenibacillus athensensis]MCD1258063.1 WYL domain-containing transcriptional regulator [Paenibacillus athensensis]